MKSIETIIPFKGTINKEGVIQFDIPIYQKNLDIILKQLGLYRFILSGTLAKKVRAD